MALAVPVTDVRGVGAAGAGGGEAGVEEAAGASDRQIGISCSYATLADRAQIDQELYLPKAWTDDRDRARAAGIGDEVGFAGEPTLARRMLTRASKAGVLGAG